MLRISPWSLVLKPSTQSVNMEPAVTTLTSSQKRRRRKKKKAGAVKLALTKSAFDENAQSASAFDESVEDDSLWAGSSEVKDSVVAGVGEKGVMLANGGDLNIPRESLTHGENGLGEEKESERGCGERSAESQVLQFALWFGEEKSEPMFGDEEAKGEEKKLTVAFVTGNPALGESELHVGSVKLTAPLQKGECGQAVSLCISGGAPLPPSTTRLIAMLKVPRRFASCDLISLLQPWRSRISHVRVTRHCEPPIYPSNCALVLVELATDDAACELYSSLHGRAFNSFEPERCSLAFVESLHWDPHEGDSNDELMDVTANVFLFHASTPNTESCVVCLEKLQHFEVGEQLFTTACDHTFHTQCLERWRDAPCPVCRYDQVGATDLASRCDVCAATLSESPLWVCLLCGFCGCEREHARAHFEQSKHAYALDVTTRHAWDFASEGFVHRLALQKTDENRKELSAIHGRAPPLCFLEDGDQSDSDEDDSATVRRRNMLRATTAVRNLHNSKLEGMAVEYNELLRTQLAKQREIYEARIAAVAANRAERIKASFEASKRECRTLDAKRAKLRAQLERLRGELDFANNVNKSLEADLIQWDAMVTKAQAALRKARDETEAKCRPLEEKVQRLMAQLDEV